MTTLQQRRRDDLLKQIERTVERRERLIASLVKMTTKIFTMSRQVRRYESIIPKEPKPVPVEQRRPAKELMKPKRRLRLT